MSTDSNACIVATVIPMHADGQPVACMFTKGVYGIPNKGKASVGKGLASGTHTVETKKHDHQWIQVSLSATATEEDAAPSFFAQVDWEWLPQRGLQLFVWKVRGQM